MHGRGCALIPSQDLGMGVAHLKRASWLVRGKAGPGANLLLGHEEAEMVGVGSPANNLALSFATRV